MLNICFLCASDEGIFLDILEDKTFFNKIETCLSLKASKDDALSTKICHKCAYEVDKCYDFVHKYKESRKGLEKNLKKKKTNCFFCQEPGKKGYFFNLKKNNQINDAFHKIYYLFEELSNETDILICLVCRYSIDLLFDLKSVSEEVSGKLHKIIYEGIDVALLEKTRTFIVRRKTTRIKSPRIGLHTPSDTESDSSIMARGSGKVSGNKANKKSKNRFCDQCQVETERGVDMFRIHRTGRTVCKDCWITMDPEKVIGKNKRKRNTSDTDTKSCKVFLKDVLRSADSRDPRPYKVDKGEDGRLVYTITDDSSGSESRSSTKTKAQLKELPELKQPPCVPPKKTSKISETIEISDETGNDSDDKRKTRRGEKGEKVVNTDKVVGKPKRGEKVEKEKPQKVEKPKFEKPIKAQKKPEKTTKIEQSTSTSRKRANGNQNSDSEVSRVKRSRSSSIELVTSHKTVTSAKLSVRKTRIRDDSESTVCSEDSSQPEDFPPKKLRERSDSIASVSSTSSTKKGTKGKKTSPISSKESSPVREFKSPPIILKSFVAKKPRGRPPKSEVHELTSFMCAACGSGFNQKMEYKSHQVLHLKNLEIKLQRVSVEEKTEETERLTSIQEEAEQDEDDMNSKKSKETEKRLENSGKSEDSYDKEQQVEDNDNVEEDFELQDKIESVEKSVTEDKIESTPRDKTELVKKDKSESVQEDKSKSVQKDKIESVQDDKIKSDPADKTESLKDKSESDKTEDKRESIAEEPILEEKSQEVSEGASVKTTEERSQNDSQSQDEDRENLEDLLQREELQVIDEIEESMSSAVDPDEEPSKEVLDEKNVSVKEESQEDFTGDYTGRSQESVAHVSTLNSEAFEEIEGNVEIESLKKESLCLDKEEILEKDETLEKDVTLEKDKTLQGEERKEFDELEQKISSPHSMLTKDEIEDSNPEIEGEGIENNQIIEDNQEIEGDKAIRNIIEESQEQSGVIENQLEPIEEITETNKVFPETEDLAEMNPTITEVEGNLDHESLSQEIADVVQNGLDQVDSQEEVNIEIGGENEIENNQIENESENKAEDTVSEVLQEVFDLATSKIHQKEETEITTTVSFPSQENLEEISNDALNGGDMPSLETDESEVSNL